MFFIYVNTTTLLYIIVLTFDTTFDILRIVKK